MRRNNRYYKTPSTNGNISAQLTYNEPIADRTYLQFSYRYNYSYNKNDRQAFVYDSPTSCSGTPLSPTPSCRARPSR